MPINRPTSSLRLLKKAHIGLLLASGVGVAVGDVLAVALLGCAVVLVFPWTVIYYNFFWGVIILGKIIDKYTLASDFLCFCVIFSFNTHLLGIGFLCQSLVHGWSSARTASHPCCTRRSWCWGQVCEDNQGQKIIKAQLVLRRSKDDQGGRWDQDDSIYDWQGFKRNTEK